MGDITEKFSYWEFACPHCGKSKGYIKIGLVKNLQALRDLLCEVYQQDVVIHINSGYRCLEYNRTIKDRNGKRLSSDSSQHIRGTAADFTATPERFKYPINPRVLAHFVNTIPAFRDGGIGVYSWGIHGDIRGYKSRWGLPWYKLPEVGK